MPVAALFGHALSAINSRYIQSVETMPIMAAGTFAGYIQCLLDECRFPEGPVLRKECASLSNEADALGAQG